MQDFHFVIDVKDLDADGRTVTFEADESERTALAERFGILGLDAFSVNARIWRRHDGSIMVQGSLTAQVVQRCVVTLRRLENGVEDGFEVRYAPTGKVDEPQGAVEVEAADEDVEPCDGESIDLGATAAEYLALAIDPYPRRPDAEFRQDEAGPREASPFAALAKLRNNI